jgi:glycosyltransferase involved in cell wall biosynthesis
MISLDRGLLGQGQLGDVIDRHKIYGELVKSLDIVVFSPAGYEKNQLSENVVAIPTHSKNKLGYIFDTYRIGSQICRQKKIDLIVTQAPFISGLVGYLLAKRFKTKVLLHFHGDYLFNKYWLRERKINFLLLPLAKFLARRADGLRVMSSGIKEKLIRIGVDASKIRVINTPVNVKKFKKPDPQKVQEIKNKYAGKKIVLFVGRLEPVKDLPTLLKAFKVAHEKYPESVLLVVGKGSLKEKLIAYSLQLRAPIKFIDQLPHKDLINYYHACNLVALSSLSESFGKVVLEAAGAGKPVVATKVTGTRETIKDGKTGFLVPVGDSKKLAEKILEVLQNDESEKKLGEEAFRYLREKFNWEKNLQAVIKFWQELVDK